jgi:Spy/CpxP family protein refolding chaperone
MEDKENKAQGSKNEIRVKVHGMSHGFLDYLRPYYFGDDSGPQKFRYVLWVDIMGSQGKMLRNVRTASIPLMKLHVAALKAKKKTIGGLELFPVIDGIYVVSEHLGSIVFFISDVFRSMAAEFLVLKQWERSVIRGAIAFGPVILGEECKDGSQILKESNYANSILLGMPLVQAYAAEKDAPPFGVFVHESVRAFGQMGKQPVTVPLWRWWSKSEENMRVAAALLPSLQEYFAWCRKNPVASGYDPGRIDVHRVLAEEYLGEFENGLESSLAALVQKSKLHESKAQEPKEKGNLPEPDRQIDKLRKILTLTDEQVEKIRPIIEDRVRQVREISSDKSSSPELRHLKVMDVVDESKARMQAVLTEGQKAILIEREHAHRGNRGEV